MSASAHLHRYTFAEYLDLEGASNVKHEFLNGEIYAMAGGTPRHAALTLAVGAALHSQLRGGSCRAFSSDLRVRIKATGLATYPDVAVVCGPLETDPDSEATVTNPRVIVEVLSKSTEDFDRGEKFESYRQVPSMDTVVYVWQTETRIEVRRRQSDDSWASTDYRGGDTVRLESIGCGLSVDDIYGGGLPS
jgi:Uma2 family endonuclease